MICDENLKKRATVDGGRWRYNGYEGGCFFVTAAAAWAGTLEGSVSIEVVVLRRRKEFNTAGKDQNKEIN